MRTALARKSRRRLAAALVLATSAALLAPATAPASAAITAAPCLDVTGAPPTGPAMNAVTVQTACSAWATTNSPTIDRWDGANWTPQQAALPAGSINTEITGVTAMSTASAWAAGAYSSAAGSKFQPLIEHWSGNAWTISPVPTLPSNQTGGLLDLSMSSATDAWAVGTLKGSNPLGILTEHWDGKAWTQVPAPNPVAAAEVEGVADISPANAWMVGTPGVTSFPGPAWIEHWDGTAWTVATVQGMPADSELNAVRALSATNVWAVGDVLNTTANTRSPLIAHYDGTSWTVMPGIPSPGTSSSLQSVAVTSTGAMAVGQFTDASSTHPLILLWNGSTWSQLPAPSPGTSAFLNGVGGTSNNYWAVGNIRTSSATSPLALHCC